MAISIVNHCVRHYTSGGSSRAQEIAKLKANPADDFRFGELGARRFGDLLFDRGTDTVTGNRNDRIVGQMTADKCRGVG
jgi:hypothetical protein